MSPATVVPLKLQIITAAAAKSLQSCLTLCDPIDGSPSGSTIPGILQARTLEWVAISFFSAWKWKVKVKSLSRPTLRDPMDCSLPGSSIHGIFWARTLEWVAISFSSKSLLPVYKEILQSFAPAPFKRIYKKICTPLHIKLASKNFCPWVW